MDWTLEAILVPVADLDLAKEFSSERLGFAVDLDPQLTDDLRLIQLTPPGSGCSIQAFPADR
ncbi:hypothetical protein [Aeromicrobium sp.]|uniref:hypothetical protein n=1 Tax=Aeromicrobium sp. TaxID=1871063 RepID=UPI003C511C21